MAYQIKNKVKCKRDCRFCQAVGSCTPSCGRCTDFKRVEYQAEDNSSGKDIERMRRQMGMNEVKFTKEGTGSRGWVLYNLTKSTGSIQSLHKLTTKHWYWCQNALRILEEEKLVENVTKNSYSNYQPTEWGKKEIEVYVKWRGPGPSSSLVPADKEDRTEKEVSVTKITETERSPEPEPVRTSHNAKLKPHGAKDSQNRTWCEKCDGWISPGQTCEHIFSRAPNFTLPNREPKKEDAYQAAFVEILIERFGTHVTFQEVQERLKT